MLLLFLLLMEEFEGDDNSEAIIDELQKLKNNPVPINIATAAELTKIPWITPQMAKSIISKRNNIGRFNKLEELKHISGIDDELLEKISPYITIEPKYKKEKIESRIRLQQKLPKAGVYSEKTYARIKTSYKSFYSTLLLEKDPYEKDYFDFVSGGIMYKGKNKIILGDYILEFGESLLFGIPPIVAFKTQNIIKGKNRGPLLYTISGENTALRGVALETSLSQKIKNFIFLSNNKIDGNYTNGELNITYDYGGDHSENLEDKDRIMEKLFGFHTKYDGRATIGFTFYKNFYYLLPEEKNINHNHTLYSINLASSFVNFDYFGEFGVCDSILAFIVGGEYKYDKIKLGFLYRYHPYKFYTLHSSPWAVHQKGSYLYQVIQLSKNTKILFYFDIFSKLSEKLPEERQEYFSELHHKFNNFNIIGRFFIKKYYEDECKRIRLQCNFTPKNISITTRYEKVYENNFYLGELFYVDGGIKFLKYYNFNTRIILFDSQLQRFRLYEYEEEIPGIMGNYFLYGNGTRIYFLLQTKITPFCSISSKYSLTAKEYSTQKYSIQLDLQF